MPRVNIYLTDVVEIANAEGKSVVAIEISPDNVIGINTRVELAEAEAIWQTRKRRDMMLAGVTMQAPETVFFAHDTLVEADVILEPNIVFGPGVSIASGAVIHAFSYFEARRLAQTPMSDHLPGFVPGRIWQQSRRSGISLRSRTRRSGSARR